MGETIFNILLLAVGVLVIGIVMWRYLRTGDDDRVAEDDARAFFEEHGHWPDETAEEAAAARLRLAASAATARAPVSTPGEDGSV